MIWKIIPNISSTGWDYIAGRFAVFLFTVKTVFRVSYWSFSWSSSLNWSIKTQRVVLYWLLSINFTASIIFILWRFKALIFSINGLECVSFSWLSYSWLLNYSWLLVQRFSVFWWKSFKLDLSTCPSNICIVFVTRNRWETNVKTWWDFSGTDWEISFVKNVYIVWSLILYNPNMTFCL